MPGADRTPLPTPSLAPDEPARWYSPSAWWRIVKRVVRGALDHRIDGLAAEVAFFALFSLPPTFLALFSAIGYVSDYVGPEATARIREELLLNANRFVTDVTVERVVAPFVDELLAGGRADLLSVGVLFLLWSASRASDSLLAALHISYAIDERLAMWRRRGLAILYTVVAILWGAVVLPLLVVGPNLGRALTRPLGLESSFDLVWGVLYWPVVLGTILVTLTAVYHFSLPWRTPFLRDLPGALLSMLLWVGGGAALRAYGQWVIESSPIYGSVASPMIVLLWLHFTAFGVLMGAELNAAIEAEWPSVTRKQKKAALREAVAELQAAGEEVAPVSQTGPARDRRDAPSPTE
jgi:membrane protein